jgi:hypothetical protein
MPDLAGPDWREKRAAAQAEPGPPRILMIGHLRGIGTISGLHLFVPEILPALTRELGPDGFEVHVVGGQEPPAAFVEGLRHPAVRLRGQISSPLRDGALRERLGDEARRLYESAFSPPVAAGRIVEELERLGGIGGTAFAHSGRHKRCSAKPC